MGTSFRINKNLLLRAKAVQDVYKEHQHNGATNEWIFQNIVNPRFIISRTTFYKYLSIPAARELKRLDHELQED